jgi:hypothetical protein
VDTLLALFGLLVAPLSSGPAYHYSSGLFREVARVRHMALSGAVDGYAASPNCAYVDPAHPYVVIARLYSPTARRWEPVGVYEVVDCAAPADLRRHYRALEVNYTVALAGGWASPPGAGRTQVQVYSYRRMK